MALSPTAVVGLAKDLIKQHEDTLDRNAHHGLIRRYLLGDHDLPYMPKGAKAEYQVLARRSIRNWLPLVPDTFSKTLFVDGYRASKSSTNAKPWDYWQANGLDARQTIATRGALEYGTAYVSVLPGDPVPRIRPLKPTRSLAWYEDEDDEWPIYGLHFKGTRLDGSRLYEIFDATTVYTVAKLPANLGGEVRFVEAADHDLGVTPLVRFRNDLSEPRGIVLPLIPLQDGINEASFNLNIAIQYASFRQRWATGLAVPVDEQETLSDGSPNPNYGNPVEPFEAAVNRLWVTDSPEAKFGDFAQTETSGHLRAYESGVKTLAAVAQTSPHVLTGDLNNLSADALAVVEASTTRKSAEYETLFGESWEQTLRLAAKADGNLTDAQDTSSQVRWRESEARSLAQTVDALGKMAQMLNVPPQALWERIPGVTETDIDHWKELASQADGIASLASVLAQANADTGITSAPAPASRLAPPTEV